MAKTESEYKEKLNKVQESMYKKIKEIRDEFAKIEKAKVDALKKTDEMRGSSNSSLSKIEEDIAKTVELASDSKDRLRSEISLLKREVEEKYTQLRTRITETITPT